MRPGTIEPSTWPQMPATVRPPTSAAGATSMSQVEVPMILVSVPGVIPPPTPPMCASKAPTATAMPGLSPRRPAHSALRSPP